MTTENENALLDLCKELAANLGLKTQTGVAALVASLNAVYEIDQGHARLIKVEDPRARAVDKTSKELRSELLDSLVGKNQKLDLSKAITLALIQEDTYNFKPL